MGVNQLYYDFRIGSNELLSPSDLINIQLEMGSTATSYEPYVGGVPAPNPEYPQEIVSLGNLVTDKNSANYGKYEIPIKVTTDESNEERTYSIYLDEPLRKVGDVSDYIDFEKGVVSQKIGNSIINKATALADTGSNNGTLTKFYFHIHNREVINRTKTLQVLGEQLKGVTNHDYKLESTNNLQSITCNVSNTALFVKMNTSLVGSTMEQINNYLSVNPLNVYYILKTPSNTPIKLPKIKLFDGVNHITVGTNIAPGEISVNYYN